MALVAVCRRCKHRRLIYPANLISRFGESYPAIDLSRPRLCFVSRDRVGTSQASACLIGKSWRGEPPPSPLTARHNQKGKAPHAPGAFFFGATPSKKEGLVSGEAYRGLLRVGGDEGSQPPERILEDLD